MKKFILALAVVAILIPQASFAAWAYKGVPVTPGTDAQIAEQIAAIDAGTVATTTPSIADQITFLTNQIKALQAQLAALQGQTGGSIVVMPEEQPAIDREALAKESLNLQNSIDWGTCRNNRFCTDETRAKIERINEITKLLGAGCTYELTKNNVGTSCGG